MNLPTIAINVLEWFLRTCKKQKVNIPFKWKILLMLIIGSLKAGKFLYLLSKVLDSINIEVDTKNKTWKVSSKYRMTDPEFQKRYYDDIDNIMKSHPELYKEWKINNTNYIIDTDPNSTFIR